MITIVIVIEFVRNIHDELVVILYRVLPTMVEKRNS
jgi:hypothetical protein